MEPAFTPRSYQAMALSLDVSSTQNLHHRTILGANGHLAWNTFADASLAILPATIFWKLNCSRTKKVQLSIVFGFNILTSICSGIKTQYLVELGNRTDFTWATYDIFMWVTAKLFLMVICGTIPTLNPIYHWFSRLYDMTVTAMSSSSRRGRSGYILEPEHELSGGVQVQTTTTIEHRRKKSFAAESADSLVIRGHEGMHRAGAMARTSRSHSLKSSAASRGP